ncbi:DNA-binding protein, partial [Escherichia coli]|nr:DNA-binding protein [Escherichia coli]
MSDLNQFRSKGPELLVELAQHTSETVREIIDIEPEVADQIGQAV